MDIEYFATLVRLELQDEEKADFERDFEKIIRYVGQLQTAKVEGAGEVAGLFNVVREDTEKNERLLKGAVLLEGSPDRKDAWLKVRPIFDYGDTQNHS